MNNFWDRWEFTGRKHHFSLTGLATFHHLLDQEEGFSSWKQHLYRSLDLVTPGRHMDVLLPICEWPIQVQGVSSFLGKVISSLLLGTEDYLHLINYQLDHMDYTLNLVYFPKDKSQQNQSCSVEGRASYTHQLLGDIAQYKSSSWKMSTSTGLD